MSLLMIVILTHVGNNPYMRKYKGCDEENLSARGSRMCRGRLLALYPRIKPPKVFVSAATAKRGIIIPVVNYERNEYRDDEYPCDCESMFGRFRTFKPASLGYIKGIVS